MPATEGTGNQTRHVLNHWHRDSVGPCSWIQFRIPTRNPNPKGHPKASSGLTLDVKSSNKAMFPWNFVFFGKVMRAQLGVGPSGKLKPFTSMLTPDSQTRVVSTIQIQHTESYRCVLRAIVIEKQVSQPHIVSKTIAANRFESYRFVSVSVRVCFEGPFGARRAAASCCCAGGCLAREALAKSLRGCLEETLFGEMESQENRLRLLQADSMLNTSQGSSAQLQPAEARNQPNSAS